MSVHSQKRESIAQSKQGSRALQSKWSRDWEAFSSNHRNNPFLKSDVLYCLPKKLLAELASIIPDFLSKAEMKFEQDLADLCQCHNSVGVFYGVPVTDPTLNRPPIPEISEETYRWLGWDSIWTLEETGKKLRIASGRLDAINQRIDAYRGWLICQPTYQHELDTLKTTWGSAIAKLKRFPAFPVQPDASAVGRPPRPSRDVTDRFVGDLNAFYDRWELLGMTTWDLPLPRGANLSGEPWPPSVVSAQSQVSAQVSPIFPIPTDFPLGAVIEEAQLAKTPAHLADWNAVRQQKRGVRFQRLQQAFPLHFYLNTVLASRYRSRFSGHVEKLDRAFGSFFDLGEDSVKKLRQLFKKMGDPSVVLQ